MFPQKYFTLAFIALCCYLSTPNPAYGQNAADLNTADIKIGVTYKTDWHAGTIIQILDDQHMHISIHNARTGGGRIECILKIKSTKGLTDPKPIPANRWKAMFGTSIIKCVDTKRVKLTDGSSRTLYLFEAVTE